MRILLDTCTFLWLALDEPQLSTAAREVFTDPLNEVFLSAASAFEIAVKQELGRLPLPQPAQRYVPRLREAHLVQPLALDEESALHAAPLPPQHPACWSRKRSSTGWCCSPRTRTSGATRCGRFGRAPFPAPQREARASLD
jgi:PIN domain nuclease of toxin-antitoxin system